MAFNAFSTILACSLIVLLSTSDFVNAYPQQSFQQQPPAGSPRYEPVSEVCLGCICESISSCNRTLTCEGDVCGMFRITWAYWADAGKPVLPGDNPNDGLAYARCTNDPMCARQTVVNYMNRFAQDCNRDGAIDCADYAAIHKLGGYGCGAPLDWTYKTKYDNCQRAVSELSGSARPPPQPPVVDQNANIMFPTRPPQVGTNVQQQWDNEQTNNNNLDENKNSKTDVTDEVQNTEILDPAHIRFGGGRN